MTPERLKAIEEECRRWADNTEEYLAPPEWVAELIADAKRVHAVLREWEKILSAPLQRSDVEYLVRNAALAYAAACLRKALEVR